MSQPSDQLPLDRQAHAPSPEPASLEPSSKRRRSTPWVALSVAIVLILGAIIAAVTASGSTPGEPVPSSADVAAKVAESDASAAGVACEGFVKQRLKSPATAQFTSTNIGWATDQPGAAYPVYVVTGAVDSQNGFGAMIRNNYTCTVTGRQSSWDLVDPIRFIGRG